MTTPSFNSENFRSQFPQFEDTTAFSDAQLQGWWTMGSAYINPANNWPYNFVTNQLQLALDLMCAHLAASFTLINNGVPVVVVQGSAEGTVNVSLVPPPVKTAFGWWLATTPYGNQLRALLRTVANVGLYVGGSPENLAFRRAGGIF